MSAVPLEFRPVALGDEPARSLEDAFRREISEMYDGLAVDGPDMPKAGPAELSPPGGTFLVGFDADGVGVACGGIKDLGEAACEIKRMYVAPRARGAGRAIELLEALEQAARDIGYEIIRLDTGPKQERAERMYRLAGYEPIGNFNANPMATFFGEKRL